ncbi:MAG: pseudaminic acid synthase [Pseudomonadota bacterium]
MEFRIDGRPVGDGHPVYIIAEVSANHGGSFERAREMIRAARDAGADAVKLQTYTADTMTLDSDAAPFVIRQGTIWDGRTLHDLYQEAFTPWEWQPELKKWADSLGISLFSTPFDATAADFLEGMGVGAHKIASFEITDIPLIEYVAAKGRPMIISTGIAEEEDIREALAACRRVGNEEIALLKCTSSYPAPLDGMNLRMIPDLAARFGVISGLSDHSLGAEAPVVAVALGARIIEKHFILDRSAGGPDAAFSLQVEEFAAMVQAVRDAEKALGTVNYALSESARRAREFSRSLFVAEDIPPGGELNERNIRSVRPGFGLAPKHLPEVLGRRALRHLAAGTPLRWEDLD